MCPTKTEVITQTDWDLEKTKASAVLTGQQAAQAMTRAVDDRAFVEEMLATVEELRTNGTVSPQTFVAELLSFLQALGLSTARIGKRGHVKNAVLHMEIMKRGYELLQQIANQTGRNDVDAVFYALGDKERARAKKLLLLNDENA